MSSMCLSVDVTLSSLCFNVAGYDRLLENKDASEKALQRMLKSIGKAYRSRRCGLRAIILNPIMIFNLARSLST